jgi:hypothetical protein
MEGVGSNVSKTEQSITHRESVYTHSFCILIKVEDLDPQSDML